VNFDAAVEVSKSREFSTNAKMLREFAGNYFALKDILEMKLMQPLSS